MTKIKELVFQKDWGELIKNYLPQEICLSLSYNNAMWLTKHLFYDDRSNDENQQFALKLAVEIRKHFIGKWEEDWKNDIFLGDLYSILWLYDEQYDCYKRAYDKLADPPAALLLLLAGCQNAPDPPITEEEAESYLRKSAEKKITFETALMMRTLYERKGNPFQVKYWDQIYRKLEQRNIHADLLIPDIFYENRKERKTSS